MHDTLTAYCGRADWYDVSGLLLNNEKDQIDGAKDKIRKAKRSEIHKGIDPVIPGRVIANLTFGFWTSLLDSGYGDSPKGPQFWSSTNNLLATAFPHAASYYTQHRSRLHRRFNDLRILRNRIFHYEPILNGVTFPNNRQVSLTDLHDQIIECIGWMSPTFQDTVKAFDRFAHVHNYGRRVIRRRLRRHLGI